MPFIKIEDIMAATNGGLDIILGYYPNAQEMIDGKKKAFKIREEKTASATVKQLQDGNYVVSDWGEDQVPRNGVQICQKEEGLSFNAALVLLAERYNVGEYKVDSFFKPELEKRPATAEEAEKEYYFKLKDFTETELDILIPRKALDAKKKGETAKKYNFHSLESVTYISNRVAYITKSTPDYPIFIIDEGEFKKIYQPKAAEKKNRFRYSGQRPKDYILGLKQAKQAYEKAKQAVLNSEKEDEEVKKLKEIIICSGDRDALNMASYGYYVVWQNSESAVLTDYNYNAMKKIADRVMNLPDIDSTGVKQATKMAMAHLDIHTIWLPKNLRERKDMRGNPRKDFKDFVETQQPNDFKVRNLINTALPLRFWDERPEKTGIKYVFNNLQAYGFLNFNGFYTVEDKNSKEGFKFIHITDHIVRQVTPREIKNFVNRFLENQERPSPVALRNMIFQTTQLNESSLIQLKTIEIDFTDYSIDRQYMFFENVTWEITASGIKEYKPGTIEKFVWNERVVEKKAKKKDAPFNVTFDANKKEYDVEVTNLDSLYFKFLINTSRIHWRKELEKDFKDKPEAEKQAYFEANHFNIAGPNLSDAEKWEQKQHLINKIFAIGYILHSYKNAGRGWAIWAMDNLMSENDESHGRSGKSAAFKAIRTFKNTVTLAGRNPKLTDNPHIYERVDEYTDLIFVDDANQYLKFDFFFEALTDGITVNPKNNTQYEIPWAKAAKFIFTSNYTLRNIDPSSIARLLYTVFSDFYHEKTDQNDYLETRKIKADVGKQLYSEDEYSADDWNNDFNFFAYCLSFYLSITDDDTKINPPMGNVRLRNLQTIMTEIFKTWADIYFHPTGENVDKMVLKEKAMEDFFISEPKLRGWTSNKFKKSLKAFCDYYDYKLNPNEVADKGRIVKKHNDPITGASTTKEFLYIKTKFDIDPKNLGESTPGSDLLEAEKPF